MRAEMFGVMLDGMDLVHMRTYLAGAQPEVHEAAEGGDATGKRCK